MGQLVDRSLLVSPDANKKKKPQLSFKAAAKPAAAAPAKPAAKAPPAAAPINAAAPAQPKAKIATAEVQTETTERVGALLAYGLLFLPFVFAWGVQKKTYSTLVRQLSLIWATLFVVAAVLFVVARPHDVPPLTDPVAPAVAGK